MKTSSLCGAGWAQGPSKPRDMKSIPRVTSEFLGRSSHQKGHGRATRKTARSNRRGRKADRLEGRTGRTGNDAKIGTYGADHRLPDAARSNSIWWNGVAQGLRQTGGRAGNLRAYGARSAARR